MKRLTNAQKRIMRAAGAAAVHDFCNDPDEFRATLHSHYEDALEECGVTHRDDTLSIFCQEAQRSARRKMNRSPLSGEMLLFFAKATVASLQK